MTEDMGNGPSGHRKTEKSGRRMAAEKFPFSRRWHGDMIATNQAVIWDISAGSPGGVRPRATGAKCIRRLKALVLELDWLRQQVK